MAWSTQPPAETSDTGDAASHEAAESGFSDHLRGLLAAAAGYFRARLELAGLEGREAALAYAKVAAFLVVAMVCLFFGYLLFWVGVIALVAFYTGIQWGWLALAAAMLHGIGGGLFLWAARNHWGTPVFEETLNELRKDQQWLATPRPGNARRN